VKLTEIECLAFIIHIARNLVKIKKKAKAVSLVVEVWAHRLHSQFSRDLKTHLEIWLGCWGSYGFNVSEENVYVYSVEEYFGVNRERYT
jgi:hypothetical protein